jgi:ligand-binding sensor domain-containing protein
MWKFVRFRLILLVLGSILAFFGKNYGQNRLFHKITVEDGLSQSSVLSFAQDKKGFMWIGTSSGLNRYDSRSFTILKQQAQIVESCCISLCRRKFEQSHSLRIVLLNTSSVLIQDAQIVNRERKPLCSS